MAVIKLAFDRSSVRSLDKNGFMRVASSHITKAMVCPYYGKEIPKGVEDLGCEPEKVYYLLRDPKELEKSVPTWRGLPLHIEHHVDTADNPQHDTRIGAIGSDVSWVAPYVDADLTVWDRAAIEAIENDEFRELSCAYYYDADPTPGEYNGKPYDFVMRNIRGNHVALVEQGRAGPTVVVADAAIRKPDTEKKSMKFKKFVRGMLALDANPAIEKAEVNVADLLKVINAIEAQYEKLDPKAIGLPVDAGASVDDVIAQIMPDADDDTKDAIKVLVQKFAEGGPAKDAEEETLVDVDDETKSAMDACGLDAEDPAEAKAFAEGVKYGEGKEKSEPEKLDREHERNGELRAEDEDEPDLEGKSAQEAFAAGVDYAKKHMTAQDEDDEEAENAVEVVEAALDRALGKRGLKAERIKSETLRAVKSLYAAAADVQPMVGSVDAMAFDSAADIYGFALKQNGIRISGQPKTAYKAMFDVLKGQRATTAMAMDAALRNTAKFDGKFAGLANIKIN